MNNLGPKKLKWLEDQGCYFEQDKSDLICDSTQIYINTNNGKVYVGLADLGEKEDTVNFIYKHRLTKLDTAFPGSGCQPVSIGFNEKEQAWYGWTHRGFGKFDIGYKVKKGSILDRGKFAYPFKCKTLEDCKDLAIAFADDLA
jgi:hypothetical protein